MAPAQPGCVCRLRETPREQFRGAVPGGGRRAAACTRELWGLPSPSVGRLWVGQPQANLVTCLSAAAWAPFPWPWYLGQEPVPRGMGPSLSLQRPPTSRCLGHRGEVWTPVPGGQSVRTPAGVAGGLSGSLAEPLGPSLGCSGGDRPLCVNTCLGPGLGLTRAQRQGHLGSGRGAWLPFPMAATCAVECWPRWEVP